MKNKTIKKILFAVFAVAICVAAYFAADLAFFQYDDPLARASLTVENDDKNLSFTYDNDAITLHGAEDSTVYALTVEGVKTVEGAHTESLPADFLGSFAAVRIDTSNDDGDGIAEHVYHIAKTDMEYTQGYTTSANVFLTDEIPFEVAYVDRDHFTVYLEGEILPNASITVRRRCLSSKRTRLPVPNAARATKPARWGSSRSSPSARARISARSTLPPPTALCAANVCADARKTMLWLLPSAERRSTTQTA